MSMPYRDGQGGEVLPHEAGVVLWAARDVRREERPGHALRDARLEEHGHREQALELAEDHLLARLGRDRLEQQVRGGARVEVLEEAVHTRLAPAGQLLAEVDEVPDGLERVGVGAPLCCDTHCR